MLDTMSEVGIPRGYLYVRDDGKRPKLSDYAVAFTRMLERVQADYTSLISQEIEVGDITCETWECQETPSEHTIHG